RAIKLILVSYKAPVQLYVVDQQKAIVTATIVAKIIISRAVHRFVRTLGYVYIQGIGSRPTALAFFCPFQCIRQFGNGILPRAAVTPWVVHLLIYIENTSGGLIRLGLRPEKSQQA